jgi:hypothetical protein
MGRGRPTPRSDARVRHSCGSVDVPCSPRMTSIYRVGANPAALRPIPTLPITEAAGVVETEAGLVKSVATMTSGDANVTLG